jgi:hypothetical protein
MTVHQITDSFTNFEHSLLKAAQLHAAIDRSRALDFVHACTYVVMVQ